MTAEVATIPQRQPTAGESAFALAVRQARSVAASSVVPANYRGEENLANVMVAMEVAQRIGASPLAVMQNLHVIQGKPSFSASFLIATVNACGRFTPMRFETVGDDPAKDDYKVRARAKDKESGEDLLGPWITWKMVKDEKWHSKTGSKWMTMPALMFMYRAAAFWTRVYSPELSLGLHTTDEMQDIGPAREQQSGNADVAAFTQRIEARAIEHGSAPAGMDPATGEVQTAAEPPMTTKEIKAAIFQADSLEDMEGLQEAIDAIPDDAERTDLQDDYDNRVVALS